MTERLAVALADFIRALVAEEVERQLAERAAAPAWLTLEQAAERYATTAAALRKRAQRGHLPGAVRDGARWLVDGRLLDAALESTMQADNGKRAGTA